MSPYPTVLLPGPFIFHHGPKYGSTSECLATRSLGTSSYAVAVFKPLGFSPTTLRRSYSIVLEAKASLVPRQETPDPDSGIEHGTETQEEALQAPVDIEELTEAPQPIITSSSSSLDEAVMVPRVSLPQDDHKAYHNLLKWVALNLGGPSRSGQRDNTQS